VLTLTAAETVVPAKRPSLFTLADRYDMTAVLEYRSCP
jgi:hypothetical protein